MNYSKVLINPLYKPPPPGYPNYSKKLETLYHLKPHISSEITLKKPFTNLVETLEPIPYEGIGHPPNGFKPTTFTLTTLKRQEINEIVNHKNYNLKKNKKIHVFF